jgi:hypothetical protein
MCFAQDAPAAQSSSAAADSAAATRPQGILPVTLTKSLDSKKLKDGDEVTAKTAAGLHSASGEGIPAGAKVVGHVTQSKARSKGDSEASLGVVFDKIEMPGGKSMDIKGVLQAVGPAPDTGPDTGSSMGGAGMNRGNGSTAPASNGVGMQPGQHGNSSMLDPHASGVVGIKNMQLDSNNSVLTSTGKEVKLDSGAQMLIKME